MVPLPLVHETNNVIAHCFVQEEIRTVKPTGVEAAGIYWPKEDDMQPDQSNKKYPSL